MHRPAKRYLPVLFLLLLTPGIGKAQKPVQIKIENADSFEGDQSLGKNVSRLWGNVRFSHQGALMYCDSAYLYQETNSLDAFGAIRIVKGDSLNLTGDFLDYKGDSRLARITGHVVMTDRKMVLETPELLYDMQSEKARYDAGGKITDEKNVLTSRRGIYDSGSRQVYFRDSVLLVNPEYRIAADTLSYLTSTRTALFTGPTHIFSTGEDSTEIFTVKGWYNTITQKSFFTKGTTITSKERTLTADTLDYDNQLTVGNAFGNVHINDTLQKVLITGDRGYSNDSRKTAWVTGRAELIQMFDADSMFMHADTLFATVDTVRNSRDWMAYYKVRFYKTDFQGKCDSLVYHGSDSTLSFYNDPVLWNEENQLTATFMKMRVDSSGIHQLFLYGNSFITGQEDAERFNQVKGRNMTGFFTDGQLRSILVEGNGQSVYYTRNSKDQFTGVNRTDCSDMLIQVDSSKIQTITMITKPDATLFPIKELSPRELRLKGFAWRNDERPMRREDIF